MWYGGLGAVMYVVGGCYGSDRADEAIVGNVYVHLKYFLKPIFTR